MNAFASSRIPVALCKSLELFEAMHNHSVSERYVTTTDAGGDGDHRFELIRGSQNLNLDLVATILRIYKNMVRLSRGCSQGYLIKGKANDQNGDVTRQHLQG
jgi:hypothetical protein